MVRYKLSPESTNTPVKLTEALLVEAVPDVDEAVGAASRERVVLVVEGDGVDRVDQLYAVLLEAVALEGVLALLDLWTRVQVFYRNTT